MNGKMVLSETMSDELLVDLGGLAVVQVSWCDPMWMELIPRSWLRDNPE